MSVLYRLCDWDLDQPAKGLAFIIAECHRWIAGKLDHLCLPF